MAVATTLMSDILDSTFDKIMNSNLCFNHWLASSASAHITGQAIVVYGGTRMWR